MIWVWGTERRVQSCFFLGEFTGQWPRLQKALDGVTESRCTRRGPPPSPWPGPGRLLGGERALACAEA